jgi:hypothetical protein
MAKTRPYFAAVAWPEVREVQSLLNKKLGSKSLRAVDFASRFVIIIESTNFEFRFH